MINDQLPTTSNQQPTRLLYFSNTPLLSYFLNILSRESLWPLNLMNSKPKFNNC